MDTFHTVIIAVIFILSVAYFIKWRIKSSKYMKALNRLPGPPALPLIGNVHNVGIAAENLMKLSKDMYNTYGSLFRIVNIFFGAVIVAKAEYFEILLSNTEEIDKSMSYKFLHPWLGTGLLTSTGSKWHYHRKMFTPTFHFKILESFFEIFREKSQILINRLKIITPGIEFDMYNFITLCTLDIICETAMGINMNTQLDGQERAISTNAAYISGINILSETTIARLFRPWLYPDWAFFYLSSYGQKYLKAVTSLHEFTKKVVAQKISERERNKGKIIKYNKEEDNLGIKRKQAFLDLLLEASEGDQMLTEAELREEVDTFMFEGHDTTTAAISWCLFLLGNHHDIQDKVSDELQDIFQGEVRNITINDLKKMKYLEMVIKETLRLYPSVPFIGRSLKKDLQIGEYLIPGGTEVRIGIHTVHHSPEYYKNPEVFNPDNFLPEEIKDRHPFAYLPFSAGPRNCIGQKFAILEEKTILASILLNFHIESVQKVEDVIALPELVLRPKTGLRVKIYPRSARLSK